MADTLDHTGQSTDRLSVASATTVSVRHDRSTWQERLLPLMVRMLVGLTIFFLLSSLVQLFYLNWRIQLTSTIPISSLVRPLICAERFPPEMCVSIERTNTAAILEANIIEKRYHQASVLLMGRVWYTYLGFLTGMILALVGAAFILGQIRMSTSEIEAKTLPMQITLRSASPGVTLCILGVALMIITFINPQDIKVRDAGVYFGAIPSSSEDPVKPPLGHIPPVQDQKK